MTRNITHALTIVAALLMTSALMTTAINVPADYSTLTTEIA